VKDFFISYNSADQQWAEWIAWTLEEAGYEVKIQAWDFRPGSNFVLEMQTAAKEAERTIAVLSPDYLDTRYPQPEWAAAFAKDPTGEKGILVPIRVRTCNLEGLVPQIIYIDLLDLEERTAKETLLKGVQHSRAKPEKQPDFPQKKVQPIIKSPYFPGTLPPFWNVPFDRNPYFTGREEILVELREQMITNKAMALSQPHALCGLGGIGKTQIAVEYAYRFRNEYQAVLWVTADSKDLLFQNSLTWHLC
jgi:hypothetical protein